MSQPAIRYILFDVDDTLYPSSSGVLKLVDARIEEFLRRRFPLGDEKLREMRLGYWQEYGTTLRGLMLEEEMDPEEYLVFIHDVPLESRVLGNPELDRLLGEIAVGKAVLTNSSREHAARVLRAVGVDQHFGHIFGIRASDYIGKPDARAYEHALNTLKVGAHECLFVDDSPSNMRGARNLGIHTVQIGEGAGTVEGDYLIDEIAELKDVLADFQLLSPE